MAGSPGPCMSDDHLLQLSLTTFEIELRDQRVVLLVLWGNFEVDVGRTKLTAPHSVASGEQGLDVKSPVLIRIHRRSTLLYGKSYFLAQNLRKSFEIISKNILNERYILHRVTKKFRVQI